MVVVLLKMITFESINSRKLSTNNIFAIIVIFLLVKIESDFNIFLRVVFRVICYFTIVHNPNFIRNSFSLFIIRSYYNYQPIFLVLFQFLPITILLNLLSSPIVGSFNITTSGSPINAQAKHNFFLVPPDRFFTYLILSQSVILN